MRLLYYYSLISTSNVIWLHHLTRKIFLLPMERILRKRKV